MTVVQRSDNDREISSGATSVVSARFCAGPRGVTPVGELIGLPWRQSPIPGLVIVTGLEIDGVGVTGVI